MIPWRDIFQVGSFGCHQQRSDAQLVNNARAAKHWTTGSPGCRHAHARDRAFADGFAVQCAPGSALFKKRPPRDLFPAGRRLNRCGCRRLNRCRRRRLSRSGCRCRWLDRSRSRHRGQWHRSGLREEPRGKPEDGEDEHEHEDGDDGHDPRPRQAIPAGGQRAAVPALGSGGIGARARGLARRHASGPSPGFGGVVRVRAASSERVAVAVVAADRRRSSASATERRESATCRRPCRVARTALTPSVQTSVPSEPMTSSARAATARSRISPTAREG
jgi:hypothetical protein